MIWIEKEIKQKRLIYESSDVDGYAQLNENLIDIQNIMKKNIDEVMHRMDRLNGMRFQWWYEYI